MSQEPIGELCPFDLIKSHLVEAALEADRFNDTSEARDALRLIWARAAAALLGIFGGDKVNERTIIAFLAASPGDQDTIEIPGGLSFERFFRLVTDAKRKSIRPPLPGTLCECELPLGDCVRRPSE